MTCLLPKKHFNESPSKKALAALTASATAWSAPLDLWPVISLGSLKLRGYARTFATTQSAARRAAEGGIGNGTERHCNGL